VSGKIAKARVVVRSRSVRGTFRARKNDADGRFRLFTSGVRDHDYRAVGASRRFTLHGIPESSRACPATKRRRAVDPISTFSVLIAGTYFSISTDETAAFE